MCCTLLTRWSMALGVNIMHGYGQSNEMHSLVTAKEETRVLAIDMAAKGIMRAVHY